MTRKAFLVGPFPTGSSSYKKRTASEVKNIVAEWEEFVHERVSRSMPSDMVRDLLTQIAEGTPADGPDPVLGEECCAWYGQMFQGAPVISLKKPSDEEAQPTFVNRILAFFYASDAKFAALQELPKEPFPVGFVRNVDVCPEHILLFEKVDWSVGWGQKHRNCPRRRRLQRRHRT